MHGGGAQPGDAGYASPGGYGSGGAVGYASASDGVSARGGAKAGGGDGVRAAYAKLLADHVTKLGDPNTSPELHKYLQGGAQPSAGD